MSAVALLTCAIPGAAAEAPSLRVTLDLSASDAAFSSALRADLEREVLVRLSEQGCYSEVRVEAPEIIEARDLRLEVSVTEYREQTSFEGSVHGVAMSDRASPVRSTAEIGGNVTLRLVTLGDELELRRKSGVRQTRWQPLDVQDALLEARLRWLENIGRMVRRFACQGGTDKLVGRIEKQRRESR